MPILCMKKSLVAAITIDKQLDAIDNSALPANFVHYNSMNLGCLLYILTQLHNQCNIFNYSYNFYNVTYFN